MKSFRLLLYSAVLTLLILMLVSASSVFAGSRPTADAGGPYQVREGESMQLDASGSFDPDQPPETLDYAWDLDDDGSYETPGMRPTFSTAGLIGPEIHVVRLRVVDDDGFIDSQPARITVTVTPPVVHPPGFVSDVLPYFELQREFSGMTVGHTGELVVADIGEAAIFGDERLYTYEFDPPTLIASSAGLPLGSPGRMATGSGHPLIGNDLVLADWNSNETAPCCSGTVFQLNHWAHEFTTLAVGNPAYPPPGDPFGVTIGQGGAFGDDIYVMDFEGASPYPPVLYRINDDGSQSVVATDPAVWTLIRKPTDIAIDSGGSFGGDLFAVDAISPPTIWRGVSIRYSANHGTRPAADD